MAEKSGRPEGDSVFPNLWKANLIAFMVILGVAVSVAVWQTRYLDRVFLDEARDHARLAAEIIKLNAQNAIEAGKITRQIISSFLRSQIKFIRYLHHIEPFVPEELAAFAREAGLTGITIMERHGGQLIESRHGWLGNNFSFLCKSISALRLFQQNKVFVLNSPFNSNNNVCVITGIDASNVLNIQQRISLDNTLKEISHLAGVRFVKVTDKESACRERNGWGCPEVCDKKGDVEYVDTPTGPVVRVQFDLGNDVLVLGMDASSLRQRQRNIWTLLLIFSAVLIVTGGIVTWLLYRHQAAYLEKMREYEERLFQERHEASLGRSAATIAHEIRNPLNSVSMGIQKILMDHDGVPDKHLKLLSLLQEELSRTERIISGLLSYARPLKPSKERILLSSELRKALFSIESTRKVRDIDVDFRIKEETEVEADPHLVHQLFENLLSNALDAQPKGGAIVIEFLLKGGFQIIRISNQGNVPSEEKLQQIFDPYFTLKTRGTGLGLPICQRIMTAHQGFIRASLKNDTFVMELGFPVRA